MVRWCPRSPQPGGISVRVHAKPGASLRHQPHRRVVQVRAARSSTWPGMPGSARARWPRVAIEELKREVRRQERPHGRLHRQGRLGAAEEGRRGRPDDPQPDLHGGRGRGDGRAAFRPLRGQPGRRRRPDRARRSARMVNKEIADDLRVVRQENPGHGRSRPAAADQRRGRVHQPRAGRVPARDPPPGGRQPDHRAGDAGPAGEAAAGGLSRRAACGCCR